MRALAFFAAVSVAGGALVFLACGDDTAGLTEYDDSGTGNGTSGSNGSSGNNNGSSGVVVPEGGVLSQNGECVIFCKPYKKAGKIQSVPRAVDGGTAVAWENPEGALIQDDQLAKITLAPGQESEFLEVTDFDFAVPDNQLTYGIKVELTRQSDDGGVADERIEVLLDGQQDKVRKKILGNKEGNATSWPRVKIGTHNYGQEEDTWGTNLNPADVNKTTFGARIAARRLPGITPDPVVGTVDALRVSVCTCIKGKFDGPPP